MEMHGAELLALDVCWCVEMTTGKKSLGTAAAFDVNSAFFRLISQCDWCRRKHFVNFNDAFFVVHLYFSERTCERAHVAKCCTTSLFDSSVIFRSLFLLTLGFFGIHFKYITMCFCFIQIPNPIKIDFISISVRLANCEKSTHCRSKKGLQVLVSA